MSLPPPSKELPWDRLATSDQRGKRIYLYPSDVAGVWRKARSALSVVLIAIFLGLPWIKVGGHQALLLDIPQRRFAIFGLTFWAHDAPLLFLLVASTVAAIALITAIWGRAWCGWGCPQTVFVEHVFRRVERWIEGDALVRRTRDQGPLTLEVFFIKSAKWLVFTALALVLSHSFLAYFVGTEALAIMIRRSPAQNPASFLVMLGFAGGVLFDFGWFREQFCTVLCPYGRFQSVLMDAQSTVVAYDEKRGEPRRGVDPGRTGDCVNCYRCVQVCPTGIDIRRGVQLECIACTACIDACDDVMTRLKKPVGLIRYGSQGLATRQAFSFLRFRVVALALLLLFFVGGLSFVVSHRTPIELTFIRAIEAPYQEVPGSDGQLRVLNHFKADIHNQTFERQVVNLVLPPTWVQSGATLVVSNAKAILEAGELERVDVFVQFPKSLLHEGHVNMELELRAQSGDSSAAISITKEVHLVGPLR